MSAQIAQGAMVCEERVELTGDVTIGTRTLVHPSVKIIAEAGPIIIGENNLIEEQTVIINKFKKGDDKNKIKVMIIGDNNVFEVGTYTEALKIGDNNIFECKSKVGREVTVSNGCIIGAMCELNTSEILPDNTIITVNQRRTANEKPQSQMSQLDFLSKLLTNFQKFKKPNMSVRN